MKSEKKSSIDAADLMLRTAKQKCLPLDGLRLSKLVFIAYQWHLHFHSSSLFDDAIEARRFGPEIPNLHRLSLAYGQEAIPFRRVRSDIGDPRSDAARTMDSILNTYGRLSYASLVQYCCHDGSAWKKARDRNVFFISDDLILESVREELKNGDAV